MAGNEVREPTYTPEDINKLEATRDLKKAELIKGDAVYVTQDLPYPRLEVTLEQTRVCSQIGLRSVYS